ncbi:MAG: ABC transporter permease [Fimbriimonadales bacterium]|nr:ABC transporter permease [Fimbriimonadales bacterium]MDW8051387.1 ABC transporter permease [Armatimonadota bacterium]
MSILENFLTALDSLRANKLRTLLTMLGVIIGVAAVITMIGIAQGARHATLEQIQRLGANVLMVRPGQARRGGAFLGFGSVQSLKLEDADAILKSCGDLVARVSPEVWTAQQVKYLNRNMRTSISGVTPELLQIRNFVVEEGRFINEQDMEGMARVAVIGHTVWQELFQGGACVGKTIRIGGQSYEVVGRLAYKGDTGFRSFDDRVYIPLPTAMRRLMGQRHLDAINIQARRSDQMRETQTCVEEALMRAHNIPPDGDPDFRVFNQGDFVETVETTARTFTFLLAGVALVSLIVGGIGIMNIMLVSVTERTREIGLRKAIGATKFNILLQFLIESVVVSVSGGLIGIVLGYWAASYISAQANWKVIVPVEGVLLAFSFAVLVGIFFGLYPAWRAAQLQPIEALRYE